MIFTRRLIFASTLCRSLYVVRFLMQKNSASVSSLFLLLSSFISDVFFSYWHSFLSSNSIIPDFLKHNARSRDQNNHILVNARYRHSWTISALSLSWIKVRIITGSSWKQPYTKYTCLGLKHEFLKGSKEVPSLVT